MRFFDKVGLIFALYILKVIFKKKNVNPVLELIGHQKVGGLELSN